MVSLGRRLPISIDTNFDPAVNPGTITYAVVDGTGTGPIKTTQITVPFYASWPSATSSTGTAGRLNPDYQQITQIISRANSTYEAAMFKLARYGRRGLSLARPLHLRPRHGLEPQRKRAGCRQRRARPRPTSAWSTEPATWTCATPLPPR